MLHILTAKKNAKVSPKPKTETKTIIQSDILSVDLIISKDCRSFIFSDKTGNKWWQIEGRKIAQKFAKIYSDPLVIAFAVLNEITQTKESSDCFRYAYQKSVPTGFPVLEFGDLTPQDIGISNNWELAYKRLIWIMNNHPMWKLLSSIRNRVDIEFFGGKETVTADPNKPDYGLIFGKKFNGKAFFDRITPLILAILKVEGKNPGILLGLDEYADSSYILTNSATYLFWILMPNIPFNNLINKYNNGTLNKIYFWDHLVEFIGKYEGESIDMGDEEF